MIVVLGASSRLGGHLFKCFKRDDIDAIGTYSSNKKEGAVKFDFENQELDSLLGNVNPSHVIISVAANPRPELSINQPDYTYKINVVRTQRIISSCFERGITPIFISTDNVFDGVKGDYSEVDATNPLNSYGEMKCEVEDYLLKSEKPYMLLRMGKVFGVDNDNTLLLEYYQKLKGNEPCNCAIDQVFTPTSATDFYEFTRDAIKENREGVFHLGSMKPTNRFEVAGKIADYFKLDKGLVSPCNINEIGLKEKRPVNIGLNLDKYKDITGKSEREIESFLEELEIAE